MNLESSGVEHAKAAGMAGVGSDRWSSCGGEVDGVAEGFELADELEAAFGVDAAREVVAAEVV